MGVSATVLLRNMPGLRLRAGVTITNAPIGSPGEILRPGWSGAARIKVWEVYAANRQLKQVASVCGSSGDMPRPSRWSTLPVVGRTTSGESGPWRRCRLKNSVQWAAKGPVFTVVEESRAVRGAREVVTKDATMG